MGHTPPSIVAGKYEILGRLGEGGQGSVWKVRHVELDQVRAMKWQPDEGIDDSASRFRREGLALARLRHPHIVEVFDFGRDANAHYLIMEYVAGQNLAQRLKTRGRPTVPDALEVARQVADALSYAHRQPYVDSQGKRHEGMIHRDIKPSNILMRDQVQVHVLLADFGLVKLGDPGERTTTGAVMGTYKYSAPEQLGLRRGRERVGVDLRADVFAFGLVLYELLEGRQFHESLDMGEVLGRVLYEDLEPEFEQPISAKLRALVTSCIRRFPEERPESMDVVLRELDLVSTELRGEETQTRFVPHGDQDIDEQIEVLLRERDRRRVQTAQAAVQAARQQAAAAEAATLATEAFAEAVAADQDASVAMRDGKIGPAREGYERAAALFAQAGATALLVRQRREVDGLLAEVGAARARAEAEAASEHVPDAFARASKLEAAAREAVAHGELDGVARDLRAALTDFEHAARDAFAVRTRREAKTARDELATARRTAEAADAARLAPETFDLATSGEADAEDALGAGDVVTARDLYRRAIADFERATAEAVRERDRRVAAAARHDAERALAESREAGATERAPDPQRRAEALLADGEAAFAREDFAAATDAYGAAIEAFATAADAARVHALAEARARAMLVREGAEAARGAALTAGVPPDGVGAADAAWTAAEAHVARGEFGHAEREHERARALYVEAVEHARRSRAEGARRRAEQARDAAAGERAERNAESPYGEAAAALAQAQAALEAGRLEDAARGYDDAAAAFERATAEAAARVEAARAARTRAHEARAAVADEGARWAAELLAQGDALLEDADRRLGAGDAEPARAGFANAEAAFAAVASAVTARRAEAEARAREAAVHARAGAEAGRAAALAAGAEREAPAHLEQARVHFEAGTRAFASGDHASAERAFSDAGRGYEGAAAAAQAAIEARAREEAEERARLVRVAEDARDVAVAARGRAGETTAAEDAVAEMGEAATAFAAALAAFASGDHARAAGAFGDAARAYGAAASVAEEAVQARARQAAEGARERASAAGREAAVSTAERDAATALAAAAGRFVAARAALEAGQYAAAERAFDEAAATYREATSAARAAVEARERAEAEERTRIEAAARTQAHREAAAARDRAASARDSATATSAAQDAPKALDAAAAHFATASAAFKRDDFAAASRGFAEAEASYGEAARVAGSAARARADAEAERRARAEAEERARLEAETRARAETEATARARAKQAAEGRRDEAETARRDADAAGAAREAAGAHEGAAAELAAAQAAFAAGDYATAGERFGHAARAFAGAAASARATVAGRVEEEAEARARAEAARRALERRTAEEARDVAEAARRGAEAIGAEGDAGDVSRTAAEALAGALTAFARDDFAAATQGFVEAADAYERTVSIARSAAEERARAEAKARKAEERARAEAEAKARKAEERARAEAEAKARKAEEQSRARAKQLATEARKAAQTARRRASDAHAERDAARLVQEAQGAFDDGTSAFAEGDFATAERRLAAATAAFDRAVDEARAAVEARERDAAAARARRAEAPPAEPVVDADRTQLPRPPAATPPADDRTRVDMRGPADDRTQLDAPSVPIVEPRRPEPVPVEAPAAVVPVARRGLSPALVAAGVGAVLAAGVVVWIVTRPGPTPPAPAAALQWAKVSPSGKDVAGREGASQEFTAALRGADGAKDVRYAWTVDGKPQPAAGPTWTFTPGFAGGSRTVGIQVTASRAGAQLERTWQVEVANVDRPPRIEAPAEEQTKIEGVAGAPVALEVRASDPDLDDGDALTYAWERNGERIASASGPTFRLSDPQNGDRIQVAVVDKDGLDARRVWTLAMKSPPATIASSPATIEPPPAPLTIVELTPKPGRLVLAEGASGAFRARATGETVSYAWLVDGRKVASDASFALPASDATDRERAVELRVADATGKELTREWTVVVTASRPQVANAEPRAPEVTLKAGEGRAFAARGTSERAGARLRYEWTLDDRPLPGAGERVTLPTDLASGRHSVQVVVLDERDLRSEPRRWSVVVKAEPGTGLTEADVRAWLSRYRAAFEHNDEAALIALGVALNAGEADKLVRGWGDREVRLSGESIRITGASAKIVFQRVDRDKRTDRELPYPSALTYELVKDGNGVHAVRR